MRKKRKPQNEIETDDQGVMVSRGQADHHDQPARNAKASEEYLRAVRELFAREQVIGKTIESGPKPAKKK